MTNTADPGEAVTRHERTSEPNLSKIQPGWKVYDRLGRGMGKVTERDDASVVVVNGDAAAAKSDETRLPIRLIADEHPDGRWATLTVSASELARQLASE